MKLFRPVGTGIVMYFLVGLPALADGSFWALGGGNPGNGDLIIHPKEDTTKTIAEIEFNSLIAYGFDYEKVIMTTDGPMILGADGSICQAIEVRENFGNIYKVVDVNTSLVEVSVFNRFVFSGDVNPTSASDLMKKAPLYTFDHDHIRYDDGPIAITTSEFIEAANPMRKIVLAAFLSGICGSPGLP